MSRHSPLYEASIDSLSGSIDLAIRSCENIHGLDRKTRTELLLGEIDEAQSLETEAVTRKLVEAWLITVNCLLLLVEIQELFAGDERIETLRNQRQEFIDGLG